MPHYLSRRNGGGYFYQRRVPMDLRHRRDVFKSQFIEVYLGTTDRATAKRKVSAINERWERTFDWLVFPPRAIDEWRYLGSDRPALGVACSLC